MRASRFLMHLIVLLFGFGISGESLTLIHEARANGERRALTVSLYPYIPDAIGAYWAVKNAFEKRHPEINLQIKTHNDYYNHEEKDGHPLGILGEDADIYEIDSVFLADAVTKNKLRPFDAYLEEKTYIPFAASATELDGKRWGAPHWVCGNFLFYRDGDTALSAARTLTDVEAAIGRSPAANRGLLIDLKGKSTLGEMYLDALMDRYRTLADALPKLQLDAVDPAVAMAIQRTLGLVSAGYGRDDDYHYRPGFYARQFSRGQGRAFVGYSEQTYYLLSESTGSCRKDEGCLKHGDIRVSEWPVAARGSQPIAWVDMLVLDAKLSGQKLQDAQLFIQFMIDSDTYKLLLKPSGSAPARYLLPAREDLYRDNELIDVAPLYPSFRRAINNAIPVTSKDLNRNLRLIGGWFDQELAPN